MKPKLTKIIPLLMAMSIITGCSALTPGTKSLTKAETNVTDVDVATQMAKRTVERLAEEKKVTYSLDKNFMNRYLDMDSFEELKQRTIAGIAVTKQTADLTEQEFQLWQAMIDSEMMNQYTVEDLQTKSIELQNVLSGMASEAGQSLSEFLQRFGMSEEDADSFVNKQAAKYVQADEELDLDEASEEVEDKDASDKTESTSTSDSKDAGDILHEALKGVAEAE